MAAAFETLGIDPKVILLQIIAFILLYLMLRRFLFRPLLAVMAERSREIAEGLEAGERNKEALTRLEEERQQVLAGAREEGREHVRRAVKEADEVRDRMVAEARDEAQEIRTRGHEAVEREREQAALMLRQQVVELAILAASRAVLQRLDERGHRRAVEDFISRLEQAQ
jgi:F-type H+-transporting ATPase subunit b